MGSFLIDSYKLRLELVRSGNPVVSTRNRIIELTASPVIIGIMERAVLAFSTGYDNWVGTPAAGFYDSSNPLQPRITGWLPSSEYSLWYDVLRSEKPLVFFCDITPIGGASYVSKISLGSSTEPTAEGPVDMST
jgi:hypothetical protein